MSADEADAQLHPVIARFQTVLAAMRARSNLLYLVKMCTVICHFIFFLSNRDTYYGLPMIHPERCCRPGLLVRCSYARDIMFLCQSCYRKGQRKGICARQPESFSCVKRIKRSVGKVACAKQSESFPRAWLPPKSRGRPFHSSVA